MIDLNMNKGIVSRLQLKTRESTWIKTEISMGFFLQYIKKITGFPPLVSKSATNFTHSRPLHYEFTLPTFEHLAAHELVSERFLETNFRSMTFKLNV